VGALAVAIGVVAGTFVSFLGRAAAAVIPRLPFTWSIVTGVLGAVLGTYMWQLLGLDAPVAVGQLTGAVVALDIYVAVAKAIKRS
jgi:putative effector of murein hydrolase